MSKLLFVVSMVAMIGVAVQAADYAEFHWKDCGGSLLKIEKLEVSPKPVNVTKGAPIILSSDATVSGAIPNDATLHMSMSKMMGGSSVKIPCINGVGSCTFKVCDIFSQWYASLVCAIMTDDPAKCKCPLPTGHFSGKNKQVHLDYVKLIQPWMKQFADGHYQMTFKVMDSANSKTLGCFQIDVGLKVDPKMFNH